VEKVVEMKAKMCGINQIALAAYSPEKAGVGGSTPSLATILFNNLQAIISQPCVQLRPKLS